jgi:hypothetical protein
MVAQPGKLFHPTRKLLEKKMGIATLLRQVKFQFLKTHPLNIKPTRKQYTGFALYLYLFSYHKL